MNLNEVKNSLFSFFANNDTFTISNKSDFEKIFFLSQNRPLEAQMILAALKEFEKASIVTDVTYYNKETPVKCWILNKPIQQYSQSIELTYPTLEAMTKLINDYCLEAKIPQSMVDPLAVKEADIQSLIVMTHSALGEKK